MLRHHPVKKSTFLEAVAACLQHEKDVFEFYIKNAEKLPNGSIKDLFYKLAEDQDELINMIANIYSEVKGGEALPNFKMISEVQKFNSTSIQILMRRFNKILKKDSGGVEVEALALATKQLEETYEFYDSLSRN